MPMLRSGELAKIVDKAEVALALCDTRLMDELATCAKTSNLYPNRRPALRQRAFDEKLTRLFAAQFPAGCFRNAAGRNELDAIGGQSEPTRNLIGDRRRNRGELLRVAIAYFRDDNQFLRSGAFVFESDGDDTAFANAIDARG